MEVPSLLKGTDHAIGARPPQGSVSRRLECYRTGIVAPFAMLLSSHYGETHRECASEARIRGSHLSAVPAGEAGREAADAGRVLPRRALSLQVGRLAAHRPRAGGGAAPAAPGHPLPRRGH